jgi:putative restriction endonuclease
MPLFYYIFFQLRNLYPQNGICLSPTFDKCFDKGFIGIDADYKIRLSSILREKYEKPYFEKVFKEIDGRRMNLPLKFLPGKEFGNYSDS